ncbi:T9SS type A sorting domain-containing protein [candidate division KSB1 bacterium]|nr:T9SS type A sorting domain-containing protein [candidate division KSB1 bacterium]
MKQLIQPTARWLFVFLVLNLHPLWADTFVVTNTEDLGENSLAWAIDKSQQHLGPDTIAFQIPTTDPRYDSESGVWVITITTPLPVMTDDGTVIDGSSQTRFAGDTNPDGFEIEIFGLNAPHEAPGIVIYSAYNHIHDLSIGAFRGFTIFIRGEKAHHNVIEGCYIGLEADGKFAYRALKSCGVRIDRGAAYNRVGGPLPEQRCIIGGQYERAIYMEGTHHNIIQGNYIGVNVTGVEPVPNGWGFFEKSNSLRDAYSGIYLYIESHNNVIGGPNPGEGNVICSSYRAGIRLESTGSDSNLFQGNYIGVGADGQTPLPNGETGIWVAPDSDDDPLTGGPAYNLIGGTEPGAGNVISGNHSSGIQFRWASHNNQVIGNKIGTDALASKLVPNEHNAIYFFGDTGKGGPRNNTVGPDNIIIANSPTTEQNPWAAIRLDHETTRQNQIFGNVIGTNPDMDLKSQYNPAILLRDGANKNIIGPDNVIANSPSYGVWIKDENTWHNTITKNKIVNHEQHPIFIEPPLSRAIEPPIITFVDRQGIHGVTLPFGQVEIFAGTENALISFLEEGQADSMGFFVIDVPADTSSVIATVTDTSGTTSMVSNSRTVPIELASFYAIALSDGRIHLQWETMSELNNFGFYIQRSTDNTYWQDMGFVAGGGTRTTRAQYEFYDTPPQGQDLWYRLRQIDFDGNENLSKAVFIEQSQPRAFELYPPFPNPFNSMTQINFDLNKDCHVSLRILNLKGETVIELLDEELSMGNHQVEWIGNDINGSTVASGVYIVQLHTGTETQIQKIVYAK